MRNTCANCENLIKSPMFGGCVIGCEKTGLVVPHQAGFVSGVATFWRIPVECPLPESEVKKSKTQAPEKLWVNMQISDIREASK